VSTAILGKEGPIQVAAEKHLICGTEASQDTVKLREINPGQTIKGSTMSQLLCQNMPPRQLKAQHQLIPGHMHQAEGPKLVLDKALTTNCPAHTTDTSQQN